MKKTETLSDHIEGMIKDDRVGALLSPQTRSALELADAFDDIVPDTYVLPLDAMLGIQPEHAPNQTDSVVVPKSMLLSQVD